MIYRRFGSTGVKISAIGVGGHHLGDVPALDEAIQLVHEAIDVDIEAPGVVELRERFNFLA